nr:MAG TPA: hypothetical protein [Caudoviricetes sp.]
MVGLFKDEKDNYLAPISYLISNYIREYDISKANINILLYKGLISKEVYDELYSLPKKEREIRVGLMIKYDQNLNKGLLEGFKEMRKMFFTANQIWEYEVMAVKKDAIYLVGREAQVTVFNNVKFVCKNVYTSYYNLGNVEFYYYLDTKQTEKLDIKGISDNTLYLHDPFMLDFLRYIFSLAQSGAFVDAMNDISEFCKQMISYQLPLGYYRELNNRSLFRSRTVIDGNRIYLSSIGKNFDIQTALDASYNLGILRNLYSIMAYHVR